MADCVNCQKELEPESFPFGDDVTCLNCGALNLTDWDYTGEDSMAWWVIGLAPEGGEK